MAFCRKILGDYNGLGMQDTFSNSGFFNYPKNIKRAKSSLRCTNLLNGLGT